MEDGEGIFGFDGSLASNTKYDVGQKFCVEHLELLLLK